MTELDKIMPLICDHLDCSDSHGQQYPDCRDSCVTGGHLYEFIKREFIPKSTIDDKIKDEKNRIRRLKTEQKKYLYSPGIDSQIEEAELGKGELKKLRDLK